MRVWRHASSILISAEWATQAARHPRRRRRRQLDREGAGLIGEGRPTRGWWPISIDQTALQAGSLPARVRATQVLCKGKPEELSAESKWRDVSEAPEPLSKPDTVEGIEGTKVIKVRGTYTGSRNTAQGTNNGFFHTYWATHPNMNIWRSVIPQGDQFEFTHELCEGTESEPVDVEIIPEDELANILGPPDIIPPCPGAQAVQIRATLPRGHIYIEWPRLGYTTVAASDEWVEVAVPSGVDLTGQTPTQPADEIKAFHVIEGSTSWGSHHYSQTSSVTVTSSQNELEVSGGSAAGGTTFVRKDSMGPKFVLRCCADCVSNENETQQAYCLENGRARTATVQVEYKNGTASDSVTLREEHKGYYVGRWNWFKANGNTKTWPPPSGTYDAFVSASPCGDSAAKEFEVVNDPQLPFLNTLNTRAMFVWAGSNNFLEHILNNTTPAGETEDARDKLLAFTQQPHNGAGDAINRIFFEARRYVADSSDPDPLRDVDFDPLSASNPQAQDDLAAFIDLAHAQGTDVEYLDGEALWVAEDTNTQHPKNTCEAVVAFNQSRTTSDERFDGVHFDIEPHQLANWNVNGNYNSAYIRRWKEVLRSCRATLDDYEESTGHQMTLSSDVGKDYGEFVDAVRGFLNADDTPLDYVTVMNYWDSNPNTQGEARFIGGQTSSSPEIGGVNPNLDRWTTVPVLFAMETMTVEALMSDSGLTRTEAEMLTYSDDGYIPLHDMISRALSSEFTETNTIGVAIHHYYPNAYADMCASGPPGSC